MLIISIEGKEEKRAPLFDKKKITKKNIEDEAKTTVQTSDPNATTSQQQKEEVFEKKPSEIKKEKRADVPMAEEGPTV